MSTTDRLRENVTVSSNVINRAAETVDVNHVSKGLYGVCKRMTSKNYESSLTPALC